MKIEARQAYWDDQAATAHFALAFDLARVKETVPQTARVLDLGCGYGRCLGQLAAAGYTDLHGVDPSAEMIERARRDLPHADFGVLDGLPSLLPEASFDLVLLIAVLTCVPADEDQRALVSEAARLLAPGGLLCVTDFLIFENDRNSKRYRAGEERGLPRGVFDTDDSMRHRHHDPKWVEALLVEFESIAWREIAVETRHGNPGLAFEYIGKRMM